MKDEMEVSYRLTYTPSKVCQQFRNINISLLIGQKDECMLKFVNSCVLACCF